ncbi:MAG: hypothetical protein GX443_16520 [Deltaproteobacteria bacterium]|nr:hypothetical protein [Deltaproteobacteria bacterium]
MAICPNCGHEFEPEEQPSVPFDEPVREDAGVEATSDAALYLMRKARRRKALFAGGVAGGVFVLVLVIALAFLIQGGSDKPAKLVKKIEKERAGGPDAVNISNALEAFFKVRATAVPAATFSDYSKDLNNAIIELNALPAESAKVEKLRIIGQHYQTAKDIWIGTILMESTPLATLEEKTLSALSLLNLIDPSTGNCKKELDKKDGPLCSSLAAFHVWKQKGTHAAKDDKARIRERLDPIRFELWKKASDLLDALEP